MGTLGSLVSIILPIFGLVALGYASRRLKVLPPNTSDVLSSYVFYFAFPALLFNMAAKIPLRDMGDFNLMAAYTLGLLVTALVVYACARVLKIKNIGIVVLVTIFGNVAYMGIPWNNLAFGARSAPITTLTVAITTIITTFWSVALGQGLVMTEKVRNVPFWRILKTSAAKLAANPLILALLVGLIFSASSLALPVSLRQFMDLLAGTAGPVALFALGAFMVGRSFFSQKAAVSLILVCKLLILPLVTCVCFFFFPVDGLKIAIAVTQAAMPLAATNFVFAQQWKADPEMAGSAIAVSTIASIVTLPLIYLFASYFLFAS